jgi:hypothetical protein
VNVWPAIVSVAVRGVVLVFADALNATVPAPVPLAPPVTVSHGALLLAVQPHPPNPDTFTEPVPPAAVKAWLGADSVYAQLTPACVTVSA